MEKWIGKVKFNNNEMLALEDLLVVDLDWLYKNRRKEYDKIQMRGWRLLKRMFKEENKQERKNNG